MSILKTPDVRELAMAQGAEVTGSTPQEFAAMMHNEIKKWAKVTSTLKLQTE